MGLKWRRQPQPDDQSVRLGVNRRHSLIKRGTAEYYPKITLHTHQLEQQHSSVSTSDQAVTSITLKFLFNIIRLSILIMQATVPFCGESVT